MGDKVRKLSTTERVTWFQNNRKANWKAEVQKFVVEGYTHDEAIVAALDHHGVPKMGRTIIRGTQQVKVV